jgi:putative transposase
MLYVRFLLSLRIAEDLLHERGIEVGHVTGRIRCQQFGPTLAPEARKRQEPDAIASASPAI